MILDTNAVSALFAGDESLRSLLSPEPRHHLPVTVIGEYRYGLLRSREKEKLTRLLEVLVRESLILPVDLSTCAHYANVRETLRRAGRPIPENDVWIAALARQHDLPIVTRDQHFESVPAIRLASW